MRIPGYCKICHRFSDTEHGWRPTWLKPYGMAEGICADCDEQQSDRD